MNSAALEIKAATQTDPLRSCEMEYHSSSISKSARYYTLSLAAIEKRFPIIARHVGFDFFEPTT